jgi:hypothetical protein
MARILSFRDLDAWKNGMDLVESCYRLTRVVLDSSRKTPHDILSKVLHARAVNDPHSFER